jgi:hypothetical protein
MSEWAILGFADVIGKESHVEPEAKTLWRLSLEREVE